jgi:hypothetical protein
VPSTILSDNGVTSGSAGLKTTAASDGALALQTTTAGGVATTALSISTAQVVTLTNALPVASGGTGSTSTTFVNLTTNVTGTLPIANGGTNSTATPTAGGIGYGTGTANAYTAAGTSGQALLSNGASAPTWGNVAAFVAGTKMLFVQTSAPTGWTKDTTNYNNHALRVVTGSASSGGTVDFTTAFVSQAVAGSNANTTATNNSYTPAGSTSISGTTGSTTLGTGEIPSHTHLSGTWRIWDASSGVYGQTGQSPISNPLGRQVGNAPAIRNYSESIGSSGGHTHSFSGSGSLSGTAATITQAAHTHTFTGTAINLAVKYLDVILATKD